MQNQDDVTEKLQSQPQLSLPPIKKTESLEVQSQIKTRRKQAQQKGTVPHTASHTASHTAPQQQPKPQHNQTQQQQMNHIQKFNQDIIRDQQQKIAIYQIGPATPNRIAQIANKLSAIRDQGVVTINMNLLPQYLVNFNIKRAAATFLIDMSRYLLDLAMKINPITMQKYTFPDKTDIVDFFKNVLGKEYDVDELTAVSVLLWKFRSDLNIFQFYTKQVISYCLSNANNLCRMVNFEASTNVLEHILFTSHYVHPGEMNREDIQMYNDIILTKKMNKIQQTFSAFSIFKEIIGQHLKAAQIISEQKFKDQTCNFAILKQTDNVDIFKKVYKETLETLNK